MTEPRPIWADLVDRGWHAPHFAEFDEKGFAEVEAEWTAFSEPRRDQARLWLRLVREANAKREAETQLEARDLQRRAVSAAEDQLRANRSTAWATWVTAAFAGAAALAALAALVTTNRGG